MKKIKYMVAGKIKEDKLTRAKAIKEFCIDCMNGQQNLVAECSSPLCPLFNYRSGKSEAPTGIKRKPLTEEHKAKMQAGIKKAKALKNK